MQALENRIFGLDGGASDSDVGPSASVLAKKIVGRDDVLRVCQCVFVEVHESGLTMDVL
jgi:hypothetical protein